MPAETYDFAIFGSNLLSALLAGLLARDHGKRVVRIGRKPSAQRLPRTIDLGLFGATRPDTWRLLRDGDAETRGLIAGLGGQVQDVEVEVHADTDSTLAALDHIAHIAAGYRVAMRRQAKSWQFRGTTFVNAPTLPLDGWLDKLGVAFRDTSAASLTLGESGASVTDLEAGEIVLADDPALLDLESDVRPPMLAPQSITMTLLERRKQQAGLLEFYPDRTIAILPRDASSVIARARGDLDVDARLASVIPGPFPVRRLATARYRTVVSSDGAPVIGRIERSRLTVIAGLADAAAFFAPALARHLTGKSTADESSWFAQHAPSAPRAAIAEFVP